MHPFARPQSDRGRGVDQATPRGPVFHFAHFATRKPRQTESCRPCCPQRLFNRGLIYATKNQEGPEMKTYPCKLHDVLSKPRIEARWTSSSGDIKPSAFVLVIQLHSNWVSVSFTHCDCTRLRCLSLCHKPGLRSPSNGWSRRAVCARLQSY